MLGEFYNLIAANRIIVQAFRASLIRTAAHQSLNPTNGELLFVIRFFYPTPRPLVVFVQMTIERLCDTVYSLNT
ncbi:MAG: hypothetical protein DMF69_24475 [Acidobacteria bacterium]|nr:MAG: hypothetical protein DMF69_24475 [Acidobacteriota bacterium]